MTTLLAVTGMSPAILTETLYALGQEGEWVGRIRVLTTRKGQESISKVFESPKGKRSPWEDYKAWVANKGQQPPEFGPGSHYIRVIPSASGQDMEDIETKEDNERFADLLVEEIKTLTDHPDGRLIASIAGGRKSMGTLLYAVCGLLARETDRITHVLVSKSHEGKPWFWFPEQSEFPEGEYPKKAKVTLADVPFVPLRDTMRKIAPQTPQTFRELISSAKSGQKIVGVKIQLQKDGESIKVRGQKIQVGESGVKTLKAVRVAMENGKRDQHGIMLAFEGGIGKDGLRTSLTRLRDNLKKAGPNGVAAAKMLPFNGTFPDALTAGMITG